MSIADLRSSLGIGLLACAALGADWPQFRGPGGIGESGDTGLPASWSDDSNIVWKTALPGHGTSSPITLGKRIYLTCYTGYGFDAEQPGEMGDLQRQVVALDRASGKIVWTREIETLLPEQNYQGFQALHGYASSTLATDGERLYAFFGKSGVFAFDLDGQPLWRTGVGEKIHNWGSATSPVVYENLVIVNASVESGSLVALDKSSGKEVWRTPGMIAAWNTPLVVELPGGGADLVVSVKGKLLGFDPATGKERWHCSGIEDYVCPSVIAHDGIIYAIGGRGKPGVAVPAGGEGNVSDKILWTTPKGSNVSSPVYHDGYLYWVSESKGVAYCIDAKNGKTAYEERIEPRPDRIYASPVVADGKVFYVSREKGVYVLAAKPEYELLAHNVIASDASIFNASPAVSDGQLLLRSDTHLYCIGKQ
jgi:hypothetical protein